MPSDLGGAGTREFRLTEISNSGVWLAWIAFTSIFKDWKLSRFLMLRLQNGFLSFLIVITEPYRFVASHQQPRDTKNSSKTFHDNDLTYLPTYHH